MSIDSHLTDISGGVLCLRCRSIFSVAPEETGKGVFVASYKSETTTQRLRKSVEESCTICHALLKQFADHQIFKRAQPIEVYYKISALTRFGLHMLLYVSLNARNEDMKAFSLKMDWELYQFFDADNHKSRPVMSLSTSSLETFEFVKKSLKICDESHHICAASRSKESWYPTRLIDLGNPDSSAVKLIITSQCQVFGQYVSLSHRWGDADLLKLTSETLPQLMDGIKISTYEGSKTFKDAFQLTRTLGIRYIWIDSLCIIQDSPEDWLRESNMMLKIYKHAYCNIAGTHGKSNTGLFRSRDPMSWSTDLRLTAYGPISGTFRLLRSHKWQEEIDNAPLNRRGWVIQERLISSRIVNFASEQVFWDCYELQSCEADPKGIFLYHYNNTVNQDTSKKFQGPLEILRTRQHFLNKWAVIAHQYSNSELSFPEKDKIIAISSLAQHLQEKWQIEYCAGLWRKPALESQLYWRPAPPNPSRSKARTPRAPSWSWLAYDGGVRLNKESYDSFQSVHYLALARVVDVHLEQMLSASEDLALLGYMELRCIPYSMVLNRKSNRYEAADPALRGLDCEVYTFFDYCDDRPDGLFVIPLYRIVTEYDKVSFLIHGILVRPPAESERSFMRLGVCLVVLKSPGLNAENGKEKFHVDFNETDGALIRLY
ncbi:HET-domain-containing protein [Acephala macrosclerotiorum]|nr:HET-domain-containing protein [Acephala macrosclerotiorum]